MTQLGREVFVVEATRTPVGRGHAEKGIYKDVHPADLLGRTYVELLRRAGIDSAEVDNVLAGCVMQIGEQSAGITRTAWLQKGLAVTTGATTIDVRCGSGQQAVHLAALRVAAGVDDVVVAGGVEHMGRVGFPAHFGAQETYGQAFTDELYALHPVTSQGKAAERIADDFGLSRGDLDAYAVQSHQRAAAARDAGRFDREIFGVEAGGVVHRHDQGIRPDSTVERLAELGPVFGLTGGKISAGNASQVSDGAAALLMTTREKAAELGLTPRVRVVDQVVLGTDPATMLTGPIPATKKLLARNGLTLADIDVVEINEAFASVVLAWAQALDADMTKVNPRGGSIALGHPLGSTGARLITTAVHELEDDGGEFGIVTMCCGGGIGTATLLQRV
ncbi:thiolase family protein [Patulibacter sp. NPDC049589]|uniref:thiolase family protein n=1 Tax=Patulibacter sp. NPDC049589 TaxID=3154731 RepID=UPI00341F1AFA